MVYPALLPLMRTPRLPAVEWSDAPVDLNGLVRFAERRNLVSARVPSHFKRSVFHLQTTCTFLLTTCEYHASPGGESKWLFLFFAGIYCGHHYNCTPSVVSLLAYYINSLNNVFRLSSLLISRWRQQVAVGICLQYQTTRRHMPRERSLSVISLSFTQ